VKAWRSKLECRLPSLKSAVLSWKRRATSLKRDVSGCMDGEASLVAEGTSLNGGLEG
jgi:hypothetical protein